MDHRGSCSLVDRRFSFHSLLVVNTYGTTSPWSNRESSIGSSQWTPNENGRPSTKADLIEKDAQSHSRFRDNRARRAGIFASPRKPAGFVSSQCRHRACLNLPSRLFAQVAKINVVRFALQRRDNSASNASDSREQPPLLIAESKSAR